MAIKLAINGFGRIGRQVYRLVHDNPNFEVVAVNDLTDAETLAYLLKYDTAQGSFMVDKISFEENSGDNPDYINVGKKKIRVFSQKDPEQLPWKKLKVDIVLECTGHFTSEEGAGKHIKAGAKKVVISAPAKGNVPTIVFGVNDNVLKKSDKIVSAASCTTNCLAPVVKVLDDKFKIVRGFMTTVHAYTSDQNIQDLPHKKGIASRRGRAAAQNIVPTSTGAAKAIGLVLPNLNGKLDGSAIRVPTITGSVIDLIVELENKTTSEEINKAMKKAADGKSLAYTEDPIVSSDVVGLESGSVFDASLTQVLETDGGKQLVKVISWYDNEMGYTAQLVRTLEKVASLK